MNVADLLHDSPSDDLRRRQARQEHQQEQQPHQQHQQQPSQHPPHHSPPLDRPRDQLRERDRPPQDLPHPSHQHTHKPLAYRRSPPPLHPSRPPSPPRHPPPTYGAPPGPGADFPAHSSQRHHLPPPSTLLSEPPYDVVGGHGSRRELPHPHDRLGPPPPGHPSSSVHIQPFIVEHRPPSLPPKYHAHSHPTTPSSVYIGPPPGRPIHASPPHTHHPSHGPGQGSIPLFPTPVGPGIPPNGPLMHAPPGPPPLSSGGGMSLRIGDPAPMYGGHGHSPHPHSQPHPHHGHHRDDRHRGRGSSTSSNAPPVPAGVLSSTASPVMASLQRPAPYDERERDRERELREMERAVERERMERERERERAERDGGPGMLARPRGHVGAPGPGLPAGPGSSLASMPSTPISPGPGRPLGHFLGLRPSAVAPDRRERGMEREERGLGRGMEREERERRGSVSVAAVSPLESPEAARRDRELRERDLRERELMEKEKARQERAMKDRERQERHAQRERELREVQAREQMQMQQIERERELRDRESRDQERMRQREMMDRDQREREREREREQAERERDGYRRHIHEMMGVSGGGLGLGAGPSMAEVEEREWAKQQKRMQQQQQGLGHPDMRPPSQGQQPPPPPPHEHQHRPASSSGRMGVMGPPASQGASQVWPRILPPQTGPAHEDERVMMDREQAERRRLEDMPPRKLDWDPREGKPEREPRQGGRAGKSRTSAKDREERAKAAAAEGGARAEPQRRSRVSAREKEQRERERLEQAELDQREQDQREMERREREREREREQREFRMREHELAWRQEAELLEQERMQRAMHEDAIRAGRAREVQGATHGQQHLHHPHIQSHSAAGTPFGPEVPQTHPKLLGGKAGPMSATSLSQDLPPQYQHEHERDFRHPTKGGPTQIQMGIPPHSQHHPHPQAPHPHQIGGPPHLRQHPQDMYGPGPMSRRPSPPPFHPQSAPPQHPAASMLPRTGSPPATLILPIKHLGTFVYPRTPFPFLDFPPTLTESGAPADPLDIRATVFLPARFLPLTRPARPRIWGGALIPAVPPLSGTQRQLCVQFSGAHPQYGRPWPEEVREGRRVYTDDSDVFLCALHAGWVSWSQARKARREGRDLRIEVRLTREARFIGGFGNVLKARERGGLEPVEDLGAEDDGRELLSSGWGNGHDGAGVEMLRAEFVLPGTAHSFGLRNRSQRMLEYAERRSALGCGSRSSRKRRRLLNGAFADGESAVQLVVDQEDEELCDTRVMVFGTDSSWPEIGFKYHPDALRAILFPQPPPESRPSKRRKLAAIADDATSATPPIEESSDDELVRQQRAVVVETLWESFLISQRGQIPASELESDKENTADAAPSGSGRRYVIALLTNAGGTMGKLSKSAQQQLQPKDVEPADATQDPGRPVSAADESPEVNGASGDVNGLAQSGTSANGTTQEKAAPAVLASDDFVLDADVKMAASASKDTDTAAQPPESIARAPSSSDESTDEGSGPIQILHRDLGEENFDFALDGINVVSAEVVNGMRKGWKLEARQWKWVQVGVSS